MTADIVAVVFNWFGTDRTILLAGHVGRTVKFTMVAAANLVEVAALVGDTARATMLAALMGGQSLTASELAFLACVSRPTASGHLGKLVNARLLTVTKKAPQSLLSDRFAPDRQNAGRHQGGGR